MGKLTVIAVRNAKEGRHADGEGLYLLVKGNSRSWLLRTMVDSKHQEKPAAGPKRWDIGLGSTALVSLAEARITATALRKVARTGGDPKAERDKDRSAPKLPTFREATLACHAALCPGWSDRHAAAWLAGLERHAYPMLGDLRVNGIEAPEIRDALFPIWQKNPVIARQVRQRIGAVLNYAKAEGWRATEAPVKSLSALLSKQQEGGNFEAMPYTAIPGFVARLRAGEQTTGRLSVLFAILTAARSVEVRKANWSEVDLDAAEWHRPASVMKGRKAHMVTLSPEAVAVLRVAADLRTAKGDCLIFPGRGGAAQSDMTLTAALRKAGEASATIHGFRSSFRDWAAEQMPTFPDAVAEAALAHKVADATIRAYKRTNFIELRRKLLSAWGAYVVGQSNVVRLQAV